MDTARWCFCWFAVIVGMGLVLALIIVMRGHDQGWRETYR